MSYNLLLFDRAVNPKNGNLPKDEYGFKSQVRQNSVAFPSYNGNIDFESRNVNEKRVAPSEFWR